MLALSTFKVLIKWLENSLKLSRKLNVKSFDLVKNILDQQARFYGSVSEFFPRGNLKLIQFSKTVGFSNFIFSFSSLTIASIKTLDLFYSVKKRKEFRIMYNSDTCLSCIIIVDTPSGI